MMLSVDEIIESIAQLPAAEQERIRRWLEEKRATNGAGHGSQAHANRSAKSLRWLDENREKYSGQWFALDGDSLRSRTIPLSPIRSGRLTANYQGA